MAFAEKVRVKREEKRLTQAELAKKTGLTQATISRIESGEVQQVKTDSVLKLAHTLGVTVDFLVGDKRRMDFDETVTADQDAQVLFRGYANLSSDQRKQVAEYVEFLLGKGKPKKK